MVVVTLQTMASNRHTPPPTSPVTFIFRCLFVCLFCVSPSSRQRSCCSYALILIHSSVFPSFLGLFYFCFMFFLYPAAHRLVGRGEFGPAVVARVPSGADGMLPGETETGRGGSGKRLSGGRGGFFQYLTGIVTFSPFP